MVRDPAGLDRAKRFAAEIPVKRGIRRHIYPPPEKDRSELCFFRYPDQWESRTEFELAAHLSQMVIPHYSGVYCVWDWFSRIAKIGVSGNISKRVRGIRQNYPRPLVLANFWTEGADPEFLEDRILLYVSPAQGDLLSEWFYAPLKVIIKLAKLQADHFKTGDGKWRRDFPTLDSIGARGWSPSLLFDGRVQAKKLHWRLAKRIEEECRRAEIYNNDEH